MKFFKDTMTILGIIFAYPVLAVLILLAVAAIMVWEWRFHIVIAMIAVCLIETFR